VTRPARLTALDGLRGLAALVVVLYHGSKIAAPALDGTAGTVYRVLADSPAKIVFAGTEAVLVFFALSGLVVALPAFRRGFGWRAYFGSRLIRLYLPVWGALLVAAALIALVPRHPSAVSTGSWLQTATAHEVTWQRLLSEATLWPAVYKLDNVLWSLRWEVAFSVALPVFVGIAVLLRRWAFPAAGAAVLLSVAGRVLDVEALVYLPVFLAGTLLAVRVEDVRAWGARRSRGFWVAAGTASAATLIAGWLARPLIRPDTTGGTLLWGLAAAGAVGLVVMALGSAGAESALSRAVPRWLGRVSFSLYLVHVPVLMTLGYLWGEAAWPAVLAVGIPASLLVAEVFTRLVETPSHRLALRVRRALSRDGERQPAAPAATVP
jgi:peptidoglycan/LPS O-acetylase OafA/YrhL